MSEINVTYNSALYVWWYVSWRLALVWLAADIGFALIAPYLSGLVYDLLSWVLVIIVLVANIHFIKNAINRHFAPREKERVLNMIETISQFYRATKSGGRSTVKI